MTIKTKRPSSAECLTASDFQLSVTTESRWIPGETVMSTQQCCPSCRTSINIEHGERVLCGCGLEMELHGNALFVWRSTP